MNIGKILFGSSDDEPRGPIVNVATAMSQEQFTRYLLVALRDPQVAAALRAALVRPMEREMSGEETAVHLRQFSEQFNSRRSAFAGRSQAR